MRGIRGHRAAAVLVTAQFAVAIAITVVALLIGDYFSDTTQVPVGASDRDLTIVELQLAGSGRAAIVDQIRATPGCIGATPVDHLPLHARDYDGDELGAGVFATSFTAGPGLAGVAGIAVRGRDLTEHDLHAEVTAALVSPAVAEALAPGRDAVGVRFHSRAYGPAIVVGVADLDTYLFGADPRAAIYAVDDADSPHTVIVVRAAPGRAAELRSRLRDVLAAPHQHAVVAPALAYLAHELRPVTPVLGILATIVGTILVVVLVGSMGLTYFLVASRTREIGLRRAMGATRRDIAAYFVLESAVLTVAGAILGLAMVGMLLPKLFHEQAGFSVRWPLVAIGVAAVIVLNLVATLIPARKAAKVPSVVASRT
jgi:putative ABC transport system permease protein